MKRILTLLIAVAVATVFHQSNVQAQTYVDGYQFAAGYQACGYNHFTRQVQREQLPYFAKFPPVYYSHIVKRPYGISPYAAPSGILPVEMNFPEPVTVHNPYIPEKAPADAPQAKEKRKKERQKSKTTWRRNPYFDGLRIVGL